MHRSITDAVHAEGARVVLQILHAGRYAKHALCVGPTDVRAPINSFVPRALTYRRGLVDHRGHGANGRRRARPGMTASKSWAQEGYLLNEFTSALTNTRDDEFGGSFENRIRLPIETVKAVRAAAGEGFLIVFRISHYRSGRGDDWRGNPQPMPGHSRPPACICSTPASAGTRRRSQPSQALFRAAWRFAIENVKRAVTAPVIASNRFNMPETGEQLLAEGGAGFYFHGPALFGRSGVRPQGA